MREIIAAMPALVPELRGTVILPGCGHWAPQEKPRELNAALLAFLGEL